MRTNQHTQSAALSFGTKQAQGGVASKGGRQAYDARPAAVQAARPSGLPRHPMYPHGGGGGQTNSTGEMLSAPLAYGVGGAGAGALLGAALGKKNRGRNALIGAGLGGGAGLLAQYLMNNKTAQQKQANPLAAAGGGLLGNILNNNVMNDGARLGGMYGGLGGAALGGLSGLIAPGSETEYDEAGNPVGTKRRSRFGSALRRALGGGVLGALGGGAAGQFAPGAAQQMHDSVKGFGRNVADMVAKKYDSTEGRNIRERLGMKTDRLQTDASRATPATTGMPGGADPLTTNKTAPQFTPATTVALTPGLRNDISGLNTPNQTNPTAGRANALNTESTMGPTAATTRGNVNGGLALTTSSTTPNFDPSMMAGRPSGTYTPTAPESSAMQAGRALARDMQGERVNMMEQGVPQYSAAKAAPLAQAAQAAREQVSGVDGISPEVLAMKERDPEGFARLIQAVRERQIQENIQSAPSTGFDPTGIDFSNMRPPVSGTMGR